MCNKFNVMNIKDAQKDAEAHPDSYGFISYWRTNYGQIRKTGYVAICNCRNRQYWRKTKMELLSAIGE